MNINGWHVVVKSRKGQVWAPNRSPCIPQSLKGLGTGHLVDIMLINIEELRLTFLPCNHMAVPELIKNGFATHIYPPPIWAIMASVISLVVAVPPRSLVKIPVKRPLQLPGEWSDLLGPNQNFLPASWQQIESC